MLVLRRLKCALYPGVYGPPIGCYAVVFVDDVSMPQSETYGAQPPIEVLRQGIDLGLWYDRKTNFAMKLIDVQVCTRMNRIVFLNDNLMHNE